MASGGNKTLKDLAWFCEVQALFLAFFSVRSIKNLNAWKKSLFEQNEKVLRSSFKIIFGVRAARVFELKKNLPQYRFLCFDQVSWFYFVIGLLYWWSILGGRTAIGSTKFDVFSDYNRFLCFDYAIWSPTTPLVLLMIHPWLENHHRECEIRLVFRFLLQTITVTNVKSDFCWQK